MNFWRATLIPVVLAALAGVGHADTVLSTTTCAYKGSSQTYTVPAGTDYITVKAWGGGGGCGNNTPGGDGACVIASYNVTPGQNCTINVGGGGTSNCSGGWPDGCSARNQSNCGGGGGSTVVTTPCGTVQCAGGCGGDNNGGWGCPGGCTSSPPTGYWWNNNTLSGCGGGTVTCSGSFFNGSVQCGGNGHPACTSDSNYPGNNCSSGGVCGKYGNGCSGGCVIVACQRLKPPVITSPLTASGKLNESFAYLITATNSPTSFNATSLPAGLTVNTSTGSISGTPTVTGTFNVTISATNAAGTGSATLVLTVSQTYTLAITGSPSSAGTYSGAGTYDPGTVVPVAEVANSGYRGSGWGGSSGSATAAPGNASTTIVMSANRTLVAQFVPQATLTVIANSGGTASGGGLFDVGSNPTITATPTGGNLFLNWTGTGPANPNAATTTVHLTGNMSVTANFALVITSPLTAAGKLNEPFSYTITATGSPNVFAASSLPAGLSVNTATGVISGTPTVTGSFSVPISAANGNASGSAVLVITVTQTYNLTITGSPAAGGTFTGSGIYDPGTVVQIAEVASLNYRTNGWGGPDGAHTAAPANAATSITMSANRTLVAQFVPQGKLVVNAGPGGSATGGGVYDLGTNAAITAAGNSGYAFSNWTGSGIANSNAASTTVAITGNETVTANFVSVAPPVFTSGNGTQTLPIGQTYSYTITATNSPTFSASNLPPGLSISSSGTITGSPTTSGTWSTTVTATNPGGSAQQNLPFNVCKPPVITSPLTASGKLNEAFAYLITATNNPTSFNAIGLPAGLAVITATGSISGTPTVTGTFNVTISATNAAGTGSAILVLTVTQTYTLSITGSPASGGTYSGAGIYDPGTVVPVSAVANSGYRASGWGGADGASTAAPGSASTTIVMSANRTLVAEFVPQATLTVIANSGGAASGGGSFDVGSYPTITATPTGGNLFVNWTGTGITNPNSATTTVDLTGNMSVTANFALVITSPLTAAGKLNEAFSYTITATGSPNVFAASSLPAGLSVNTATGVISGTPTVTGSFSVPIYAANGNASGSAVLVITVTQTYSLTITGSPAAGGTFTGEGVYDPGTVVQIAEVASLNYRTNGWGGADAGATAASGNAATSIVMSANRVLVAQFVAQGKLVVIAGPGGTATGGGVYDTGTNASVVATPNSGSVFTGWSGPGIANADAASTTDAVTGNQTVTANFMSGTPEQLGTITFPDAVPPGLPGETATTTTMPAVFVNSGSTTETITGITTTGDFQPTVSLPIVIAPGASASVMVTFAPSVVGQRTGVLVAVSDSSTTPLAQFTLQGTGIDPSQPPTATITAPATAYSLSPLTVTSTASAPNDDLTLHSIEWLSPTGAWTVSTISVSGGTSNRSLAITFPTAGVWTLRAGASVDNGLTWVYSPTTQINVSPGITTYTLETMAVPGSSSAQIWYTPSPVAQQTYQVQHVNQ